MDPDRAAIEVAAARLERWIGASLRAEHFRTLTASARATRQRPARTRSRRRTRPGLLWMLVVSAAGYWLLS